MKYVYGDLIALAEAGEFDVIVHGCNIYHTMGAGIAGQLAQRFPEVLEADKSTEYGNKDKLGKMSAVHIRRGNISFTVFNMYTQEGFSRGRVHVDYQAICTGFAKLREWVQLVEPGARIGIPMIGSGLAGGAWNVIEVIIDSYAFPDLTCVRYKP